jgi:hypothetical protein
MAVLGSLLVSCLAVLPAQAQASRTWVSGTGNDADPCTRTMPCKTFAHAISETSPGGEINCLDHGGFGGATITKSLTISCDGVTGGVLVTGTNAIVVNAAATDKVTIRGLDINGFHGGADDSLCAIKILSAREVNIIDNRIYSFKAGIVIAPTSPMTSVMIVNNYIHDNGIGVINAPGNNTITFTAAVLRDNKIVDNTCGVANGSFGTNASTPDKSVDCGLGAASTGINKTAVMKLFHNGLHLNSVAVFATGNLAQVGLGWNEISESSIYGIRRVNGAQVTTFGTNIITNYAATDSPNLAEGLQ